MMNNGNENLLCFLFPTCIHIIHDFHDCRIRVLLGSKLFAGYNKWVVMRLLEKFSVDQLKSPWDICVFFACLKLIIIKQHYARIIKNFVNLQTSQNIISSFRCRSLYRVYCRKQVYLIYLPSLTSHNVLYTLGTVLYPQIAIDALVILK